ncbi:2'-5' RNA ligase family protein [Deminuibacter soli]|nr:2'-5' RNA ligase family protein [Deminuibacter soli]
MNTGWVQPAAASAIGRQAGYEYQLIVRPGAAVAAQVLAEKQLFAVQFGHKGTTGAPHIVVASFTAREEMEETIIRWMHRITSVLPGFAVTLNNYSSLPPHTIYLRVQDPLPFAQLAAQLKAVSGYIESCACAPVQFTAKPHLNIAGQLTGEVYEKAIPVYSRQTFHETFEVTELVLLRRRNQFEEGREINVFRLLPAEQ